MRRVRPTGSLAVAELGCVWLCQTLKPRGKGRITKQLKVTGLTLKKCAALLRYNLHNTVHPFEGYKSGHSWLCKHLILEHFHLSQREPVPLGRHSPPSTLPPQETGHLPSVSVHLPVWDISFKSCTVGSFMSGCFHLADCSEACLGLHHLPVLRVAG